MPSTACSPGCESTLRVKAGPVLVVVNATPTPQYNYRLGVPVAGRWDELLNSDAGDLRRRWTRQLRWRVDTAPLDSHDHRQSVVLTAPPLGVVALAPEDG